MSESMNQTRNLTAAAAAAAISVLFVLLKLIAPFLVFFTMLAGAVPIALLCRFHGMKWGVLASVAEIFLVTIIGGAELGITTAFYPPALGLAIGWGRRHQWSQMKTMTLTVIAYLVEMSYKVAVSYYVLDLANAFEESMEQFIKMAHYVWKPVAYVFGYSMDPDQAVYTTAGLILVALVFILNAWCYAYLNTDLEAEMAKRLEKTGRF
jgi:uncharacterized protein YybS (DUF2232 family)